MALKSRIRRLEAALARTGEPGGGTTIQYIRDVLTLCDWLTEHGYPDQQAALEAGEAGPEGLGDLLREQAAVGYYHEFREYLPTCRPVPEGLVVEFEALKNQVGTGPEARWLEVLPQLQRVAWRLREATDGESRATRRGLLSTCGGVR